MNRQDALAIFEAAIKAVQPAVLMPSVLKVIGSELKIDEKTYSIDSKRIFLLSVGKAAAAMAVEVEHILGDLIVDGLVVTKYDHALPLKYCRLIEAGHPLPDEKSKEAADEVKAFLQKLDDSDLLIVCISGGASALLADMEEGISLEDLQKTSKLLLRSGASIHELNAVRKNISALKGGGLVLAANGASIVSLIISDVAGDDLSSIASGLTVRDSSTPEQAFEILQQYQILNEVPESVRKCLDARKENISKKNDSSDRFDKVYNKIIGSNSIALQAAAGKASSLGYDAEIVDADLKGEAAARANEFVGKLQSDSKRNICYLMGGETTVTISGNGKGGRNQQFALAALAALQGTNVSLKDCPVILSGGTDGTDGPTDAAGAVIDGDVLQKTNELKLDVQHFLDDNDAWHFFKQTGGLVITGPTQTNVMDVVIGGRGRRKV